ncbi:MAG: YbaY family lipoprotein [Pseudomonadota bacterium]
MTRNLKLRKPRCWPPDATTAWFHTALIAALIWLAPADTVLADDTQLDITLSYRERIAPPPDAVAEVMLLDVSRADVAAPRLSSQRFKLTGVPMTVTLRYDPELIDARLSYSVSATILSGDSVMFRTTEHVPVLTEGASGDTPEKVEIVLTQASAASPDVPEPPRITGFTWTVEEIGGAPLTADPLPRLKLETGGQFSLFSGCNTYAGTLETGRDAEGRLTLLFPEHFAGTLMACEDELEDLQRKVLEAVATVTGYARNGDRLTLTDEAGATALRLRIRNE